MKNPLHISLEQAFIDLEIEIHKDVIEAADDMLTRLSVLRSEVEVTRKELERMCSESMTRMNTGRMDS